MMPAPAREWLSSLPTDQLAVSQERKRLDCSRLASEGLAAAYTPRSDTFGHSGRVEVGSDSRGPEMGAGA